MVSKDQIYIKKSNKLEFKVIDVIGNEIHFQESGFLNTKVMNEKDFLNVFELK